MTSGRGVRTAPEFDRAVKKLDRPTARVIIAALEKVASSGDPRSRGRALTGNRRGYWRYRVGDHWIIAYIDDREMVIIAIDVGHRSTTYRR